MLVYAAIPVLWMVFILLGGWWPRLGKMLPSLVRKEPSSIREFSSPAGRLSHLTAYHQGVLDCFRPSDELLSLPGSNPAGPEPKERDDFARAYELSQRGYLALNRLQPPQGLENAHDQLIESLYLRAGALDEIARSGSKGIVPLRLEALKEKLAKSAQLFTAGMAMVKAEEQRAIGLLSHKTSPAGG
jgi:hypothetical protein